MRILANVIWFATLGWVFGLVYFCLGILLTASIIGIPLAPAAFRLAKRMAWPLR